MKSDKKITCYFCRKQAPLESAIMKFQKLMCKFCYNTCNRIVGIRAGIKLAQTIRKEI